TLDENVDSAELLDPVSQFLEGIVVPSTNSSSAARSSYYSGRRSNSGSRGNGTLGSSDLWSIDEITIYQSADVDICIDESLPGYDNMYWQTSNTGVIAGFYSEARSYLGYSSSQCRFPKIVGTGTTTVTAGTYDGEKRDTLTVNVIPVPGDEWKQEVLSLVNNERAKAGIGGVSWGDTCAGAAMTRAEEIKTAYAHTRPDGSAWYTVCPIPSSGGKSGENLAAGSAAVSPETVVQMWMNSEEHKKNILDPEFTKLSVGFSFDPNTKYKTYWSQIFSTY
ncbi:CAP domain-containing protein, partial [Candidatus Saccharibacteria bacterium]|nr:CAP domain-containing protein [Candidatus Saccharibacteria bacterium]